LFLTSREEHILTVFGHAARRCLFGWLVAWSVGQSVCQSKLLCSWLVFTRSWFKPYPEYTPLFPNQLNSTEYPPRYRVLTLILLTSTKWWAPASTSKWRMGFNSAFKGFNKNYRILRKFSNIPRNTVGNFCPTIGNTVLISKRYRLPLFSFCFGHFAF
jgi:hypothetical protein